MSPITLQEPFRAVFYAPFYAALARGDYAAEGVAVTLRTGTVPANAKDAVLAGVADLAWGGPMRILLAHEADPASPLRNFGAVVMRDPFFLVGRAPRPGFGLAELAELTLGTVSEVPTPWWTLQHDIRLAGLDPTMIRRVTDQGMAANLAAVLDGSLDVAQLFEPFVTQAEDAGAAVWHTAASRGVTGYTTFTTHHGAAAGEADGIQGDAARPGADAFLGGGELARGAGRMHRGLLPGHAAADARALLRTLQVGRPLDRRPLLSGGSLHPAGDGDVHRRRHHPEARLCHDGR